MVNIPEEEKLIWQSGQQKDLIIAFDDGMEISNDDIYSESMTLEQTLSDESNIKYGKCSAACFKIRISDTAISLKNKWFTARLTCGEYTRNLGRFKVFSDNRTDDRRYKDIVAYDAIYTLSTIDCTNWYKGLTFPLSMKAFRDSFFSFVGIVQESTELPNDWIAIEKTIDPSSISGITVAESICELNARFGQMDVDGKFKYVDMDNSMDAIYPKDDLYPNDNLFPKDNANFTLTMDDYAQGTFRYEDFETQNITKVTVREQEGDVGGTAGNGNNEYFVTGNFLVYGQSQENLNRVASGILNEVTNIYYHPASVKTMDYLPFAEVGDFVKVIGTADTIVFPILKRTISGITGAKETYTASGTETMSENPTSISDQIIQLKGQSNVLTRTIDETKSTVTKLEENTNGNIEKLQTQITQNAESITLEAKRATGAEDDLSSKIEQTADSIVSSISRNYGKYDETGYSIDNYGITTPTSNSPSASLHNGQYYLDQSTGKLYLSNGISWNLVKSLQLLYAKLDTKIEQNSESIISTVAGAIRTYDETGVMVSDRGFGTPTKSGTQNYQIYLDQNSGRWYRWDGTQWVYKGTLPAIDDELSSQITQLPHTIDLSVGTSSGRSTGITISLKDKNGDVVDSDSGTITLSGDVIIKSNLTDGTTQISGDNIKTGTVSAEHIDVTGIFAQEITASGSITSESKSNGFITISNGALHAQEENTRSSYYIEINGGNRLLFGYNLTTDIAPTISEKPLGIISNWPVYAPDFMEDGKYLSDKYLAKGGSIASGNTAGVTGGDIYSWLRSTNTRLRSSSEHSGTVSVNSGTNTTLHSFTLTPGAYVINARARENAGTGTHLVNLHLSTSNNGTAMDRYSEVHTMTGASKATDIQVVIIRVITANTTYYIVASQDSGSARTFANIGAEWLKIY